MNENTIICGPALEVLKGLPAESINCCISSPPYWALRDYGVDGQLGLEKTFEEYIDKLCAIYDEVKRVLRKDGTCWVNLGDTFWGGKGQAGRCDHNLEERVRSGRCMQRREYTLPTKHCPQDGKHEFVQAKSLCLIPQRFAIEMVNRGWILRNTIIWHKPNPMPSSAKDRFTVDFEQVFFFVKSNETLSWVRPDGVMASKQPDYKSGEQGLDWEWGERKGKRVKLSLWKGYCYFFEPQYEPYDYDGRHKTTLEPTRKYANRNYSFDNLQQMARQPMERWPCPMGRNKRTVWTIPTQAYPDAHFATFPEKLVEPMILSGCPKEVCSKCGQGRRKVYESNPPNDKKQWPAGWGSRGYKGEKHTGAHTHEITERNFKGYTDCGCGAEFVNGVVLDPFGGAMTTALVAYKNKRDYIMLELKPEYVAMGQKRLDAEKEKYGLLESGSIRS